MATPIVDLTTDPQGIHFCQVIRRLPVPDFVKSADDVYLGHNPDVPGHLFADPVRQRYVHDSAASTWLSAAYLMTKKACLDPRYAKIVENNLRAHFDYYGIGTEWEKLATAVQELPKDTDDSIPEDRYAFCRNDEASGTRLQYLPIKAADDVALTTAWLYDKRADICFEDRHHIATRLLKIAAELDAPLTESMSSYLHKCAGDGVGVPSTVAKQIRLRRQAVKVAEDRLDLEQLERAVLHSPKLLLVGDMAIKLATVIDQIDRNSRLTRSYGGEIQSPEDIIFGTSFEKAAQELDDVCELLSGTSYSKHQLRDIRLTKFAELFGDDLAASCRSPLGRGVDVEKLAELLPTLPRPDAELFDALMSEMKIEPLDKVAADIRIDEADLEAAAAAYA